MVAKRFWLPFADGGDTTVVPDEIQIDGTVSIQAGWPFGYQRDLATDPLALPILRDETNWIFNAVTDNIKQYQEYGFPEWDGSTNPFTSSPNEYQTLAVVIHAGGIWQSLVDNNTAEPGTDPLSWGQVDLSSAAQVTSAPGHFANLKVNTNGVDGNVSITADVLVPRSISDASVGLPLANVAVTPTTGGLPGADSIDTGTWAINTWYYVYVICSADGTSRAGLFSLSATAPVMPSGYVYFQRVGAIRTDGTVNYYPLAIKQNGNRVYYRIGNTGNTTAIPLVSTGPLGGYLASGMAPGNWTAISIAGAVPPTAFTIGTLSRNINNGCNAVVAPSDLYGGPLDPDPPPLTCVDNQDTYTSFFMQRLSDNIYAATGGNPDNGISLHVFGWEDSL